MLFSHLRPKQLPLYVYQLKFFKRFLCFPGALRVPPIEEIIVIIKLCQELGLVTLYVFLNSVISLNFSSRLDL